jgi:hypothetical protein
VFGHESGSACERRRESSAPRCGQCVGPGLPRDVAPAQLPQPPLPALFLSRRRCCGRGFLSRLPLGEAACLSSPALGTRDLFLARPTTAESEIRVRREREVPPDIRSGKPAPALSRAPAHPAAGAIGLPNVRSSGPAGIETLFPGQGRTGCARAGCDDVTEHGGASPAAGEVRSEVAVRRASHEIAAPGLSATTTGPCEPIFSGATPCLAEDVPCGRGAFNPNELSAKLLAPPDGEADVMTRVVARKVSLQIGCRGRGLMVRDGGGVL